MKAKHFLLPLVILLAVYSVTVTIIAADYNKLLQRADDDMTATDEYYQELMGDYQIDVFNNTMWIRDYERTVDSTLYDSTNIIFQVIDKDNL